MKEIIIKNITVNDVPYIRECVSLCKPLDLHTPFTYWVIAEYFNKCSFVINIDNNIIGFITSIKTFNNSIFIWQIGIINEYRNKGLSKILINKVFESAKKENIKKIQVSIDEKNSNSYNAFLKYAYENGYNMKRVSKLSISDFLQENFLEEEIIYEFDLF